MKSGKGRPGWILEIHDKAEQEKAIDAIARNDVFRNQFRVEQDAPKCGLETIDWGLRHIERLRKDAAEERQTRRGIWTSLIIPFSSLVVAVISVLGTVAVQWYSIREQAEMKRYEVGFKPKQDAYSKFMIAFTEAMTSAAARDKAAVFDQLKQMEGAFYLFEPFLTIQQRVDVHEKFAQFTSLCIEEASKPSGSPPPNTAFTDQAVQLRVHFQKQLYAYLFG